MSGQYAWVFFVPLLVPLLVPIYDITLLVTSKFKAAKCMVPTADSLLKSKKSYSHVTEQSGRESIVRHSSSDNTDRI